MDASEIYAKRLNAKEVIFPKENGIFIVPVADGRIKFAGGDLELRTSTLTRDCLERGEEQEVLQGKSVESHSPPFTRFIFLNERPPDGKTWSGGRFTRKQTTSRPYTVWPDMWTHMFEAAKKRAKQRWAIEKPKLDNARQLRGIIFIEPNDEEFKLTKKAARTKLDVPTPAAMPCKYRQRAVVKPTATLGNARQNTLVLSMPTKARDQGFKELDTNLTKIKSLRKG